MKSPLIRRFGLVPQWVRTLSTHAIASQAQSRRLNGNLTRLDRNSLRSFREFLRRGFAPFGDWLRQFRLSPNSTRKRREATFAVIRKRFTVTKFKNTARGKAALSRLVASERGLNCRPLWHFCKQKSPIPSQLPHAFGFGLRSDGGLSFGARWAHTEDWAILPFRGDRRNLRSKSP